MNKILGKVKFVAGDENVGKSSLIKGLTKKWVEGFCFFMLNWFTL